MLHLLGRRRYFVSDAVANACFALQPSRREATIANYRAGFPGIGRRRARRYAAQSYRRYARTALDFVYLHRLPRRKLIPLFQVAGAHHFFEVQEGGQGGILVLIHQGSWDAAGAYASTALGIPITAVMADEQNHSLARLVIWARSLLGIEAVAAARSPRKLIATLRSGRWLALLADIPGDTPSVTVDFLGRRTYFSVAPGLLAAHSGVPLVAVTTSHTPAGGYLLEAHPPLRVARGTPPDQALAPIMRYFEAAVRRWPYEWFPFDRDRLFTADGHARPD